MKPLLLCMIPPSTRPLRFEIFQPQHLIARILVGANEFVQFQLNRRRIPVLRVLDKEHHKERDDRCAGVDDQLPCVGKMKSGTSDRPNKNDKNCYNERVRASALLRGPLGGARKTIRQRQARRLMVSHFEFSHIDVT
jgi:hypothetical protein